MNGVRVFRDGKCGRLTLDRPGALHALNFAMCEQITDALLKWKDDDAIELVVVDHLDGTRGFCAGGDVAMLAKSGQSDGSEGRAFFEIEYRLNSLIASYPKPYIAIMDGVTMGGGVGISIHGDFQIATERTVFAMPETGIGLIPDVGGSWFLPRLEGEIGTWLALTGARLKGEDVLAVGLATHYCDSRHLMRLKAHLCSGGVTALERLQKDAAFSLADRVKDMNELFAGEDVTAIRFRLERGDVWAKQQATKIAAKSPTASKITLRQLRTGAYLSSVQAALRMEYRIASRLINSRDFQEGVRAVILDKDHHPQWDPPNLRSTCRDQVAQYFSPLTSGELQF